MRLNNLMIRYLYVFILSITPQVNTKVKLKLGRMPISNDLDDTFVKCTFRSAQFCGARPPLMEFSSSPLHDGDVHLSVDRFFILSNFFFHSSLEYMHDFWGIFVTMSEMCIGFVLILISIPYSIEVSYLDESTAIPGVITLQYVPRTIHRV